VLPHASVFTSAPILLLLVSSNFLPPAQAAPRELEVRWSELHTVLAGRAVALLLTDGTKLEGKYAGIDAGSLSIHVTRSSRPASYGREEVRLARNEIQQIRLKRHAGWKARIIGLSVGAGLSVLIVASLHTIANNEGGWSDIYAGVAAGTSCAAVGSGYLIGWAIDRAGSRKEQIIRIAAEGAP